MEVPALSLSKGLAKTTKTGDQHMTQIKRYVRLDVHKDTIVLLASRPVADAGREGDGTRSAKMALRSAAKQPRA